ncbi:hypothetical protein DsansV1_C10g0101381 [Dioscorea sansibarensis]
MGKYLLCDLASKMCCTDTRRVFVAEVTPRELLIEPAELRPLATLGSITEQTRAPS